MEALIDGLFVTGIFINLIKGGDLLLRKHQREALQSAAETAALVLEETHPLRWFRLFSWSVSRVVLIAVGFVTIGASLYLGRGHGLGKTGVLGALRSTSSWLAWSFDFLFNVGITAALIGAGFLFVPMFLRFIFGEAGFWFFLFRYLLFTVGMGIFVFIVHAGSVIVLFFTLRPADDAGASLGLIDYALSVRGLTDVLFLTDGIATLYSVYLIPVLAGILAIAVEIILACLSFVVALLRGIVWRIVEYDKGVWAAILLLLTIGLGVSELWLKTTKQRNSAENHPVSTQEKDGDAKRP